MILPPLVGSPNVEFKSLSGQIVAQGYNRVVVGGRGPYVEFERSHLVCEMVSVLGNSINFDKPENPKDLYYFHLCPKSDESLKIYFQLKTVKYADYKVGKFYISPSLLDMSTFEPKTLF